MKRVNKIIWWSCFIISGTICFHFLGFDALASESSGGWRPIYDEVLLWLNFGILVFIFIKYGRIPLMNFLSDHKEKIARNIERIEEKKKQATDKITELNKTLDASAAVFAKLKDRIVQQGEKKKQEIIESAQQQSRFMMEDANRRNESYLLQAKKEFKAELIDAAIELAMERLPQEITDEDNEKLINQYLTSAVSE